jgi:hypothetical protein
VWCAMIPRHGDFFADPDMAEQLTQTRSGCGRLAPMDPLITTAT